MKKTILALTVTSLFSGAVLANDTEQAIVEIAKWTNAQQKEINANDTRSKNNETKIARNAVETGTNTARSQANANSIEKISKDNEMRDARIKNNTKDIAVNREIINSNSKDIEKNRTDIDYNRGQIEQANRINARQDKEIRDTNKRVDENRSIIETNKREIESNSKNIDRNAKNIDANSKKIDEVEKNTNKRIDDTNKRVDENGKKIDQNRSAIEDNQKQIDGNRQDIEKNGKKIDSNSKEIQEAKDWINGDVTKEYNAAVTEYNAAVEYTTAVNQTLADHEGRIDSLEKNMKEMGNKMLVLEDRMDGVVASSHAINNARPVLAEAGQFGLGMGIGAAGQKKALAFGGAYQLNDAWSVSTTVNYETKGKYSKHQLSAGVGAQVRF